jgi:hypothetical protein
MSEYCNKRVFIIYILISLFFFAAAAPADEHSYENTARSVKCGTPDIVKLLQNSPTSAAKIAQRTAMDAVAVSSLKHFRVHYDTTGSHAVSMLDEDANNIPDYVDSTLVYLEYAWDLEINRLGYPEPVYGRNSVAGDATDVYLKDLNNNTYGQTTPESLIGNSATSFIEIDNDFSEDYFYTKGYDALKVTTAHEFFHVIQFSLYYNLDLIWWMEQSAVWMEERAWSDVNDYLAYLYLFFNNNQTPLNSTTGTFIYGAAIWAQYLAIRFGDGIILDIWEQLLIEKSNDIASFDTVIPIGLDEAFGDFAAWNYFTHDRANNSDFYPDSDLFPVDIDVDLNVHKSPASDTLSTKSFTSRYVELLFAGEWDEKDTLSVKVSPLDGGRYKNSLIFFNTPYEYEIINIDPAGSEIVIEKDWSKAVLISSCVSNTYKTHSYAFDAHIIEPGEITPQYAFSVAGTYPNPFNSLTTISFTLPSSGHVSIQAYDILGRKAEDIFAGTLDAGEKEIIWIPHGLSGGVYFIKMNSQWGSKVLKTLFLK